MKIVILLAILFFCSVGCFAQYVDTVSSSSENNKQVLLQSINTAGGPVIGENGSGSYSIGQLFVGELISPASKITEGVLHQKDLSLDVIDKNISIKTYPNPAKEYIFVEVDDYKNRNLSYQLVNLQGKLLTNAIIQAYKTKITSNFLSNGIYIISVREGSALLKSFKFIKN